MERGRDSSWLNLKRGGDGAVIEVGVVPKKERETLALRERGDRGPDSIKLRLRRAGYRTPTIDRIVSDVSERFS